MIKSGNVTIMATDFERAFRFYTETLGFKAASRFGNEWAEVKTEGLTIGIHPRGKAVAPPAAPDAVSIGLEVDSIEREMEVLQGKGIRFERGPVEDGMVRLAFFKDPEGTPLYLCEVKHASSGPPN